MSISYHFDSFIRPQVCSLSAAPPDGFGCPTNPPTPEPVSTVPSLSPAPTRESTAITIRLDLTNNGNGVSWRIETLDEQVLHSVEKGTYTGIWYTRVEETINVPLGAMLNFVLVYDGERTTGLYIDPTESAAADVFLGTTVDYSKTIARVNKYVYYDDSTVKTSFMASEEGIGRFGGAPAPIPIPPEYRGFSEAAVTVAIKFDTYPMDTSWEIRYQTNGATVASGGPYGPFEGRVVSDTITLLEGATYEFTAFDENKDGICCQNGNGNIRLSLGSQTNDDNLLVFDDGEFASSRTTTFTVSTDNVFALTKIPSLSPTVTNSPTATMAPTVTPIQVTVSIFLDAYPLETSWAILDGTNEAVLFEGAVVSSSATVETKTVLLSPEKEYIFEIYDSAFDGLFDNNFAAVSIGPEYSEDALLAHISGSSFRGLGRAVFTASTNSVIDLFTPFPTPPPYPDFTPWPTSLAPTVAPTTTSLPTFASRVVVTIELEFKPYHYTPTDEYVVTIETADSHRVVYRDEPVGFFSLGSTWTRTTFLDEGREYLFTIKDLYGVGEAEARVYLGTSTNDIAESLVVFDDNFGFVRKQFFVASEQGRLDISASPSSVPTNVPSTPPSLSVAPTGIPTTSHAPSISNSPTTSVSAVLLLLDLDWQPYETSWRITDSNGMAVVSKPAGTYEQWGLVPEVIELVTGAAYTLTINDSGQDGICCSGGRGGAFIFLGTEADRNKVLAFEDGSFQSTTSHSFVVLDTAFFPPQDIPLLPDFTFPPTQSPTTAAPSFMPTSSPIPTATPAPTGPESTVLLLLNLGDYPEEASWSIMDSAGVIVASVPRETYTGVPWTTETIELEAGETYILRIMDWFSDGSVYLFLGTEQDRLRTLAYDDGSFGSVSKHTFVVSDGHVLPPSEVPELPQLTLLPSASPSVAPSHLPSFVPTSSPMPSLSPGPTGTESSVLLLFEFDSYGATIGWRITDSEENVVAWRTLGTYRGQRIGSEVIGLQQGETYVLYVSDSFGDGLCCRYGEGRFFLFLGRTPDTTKTLVYNDGRFGSYVTHEFTVSDNNLIPAADVPVPPKFTLAPTSTRSPTAFPTPYPTNTPTVSVPSFMPSSNPSTSIPSSQPSSGPVTTLPSSQPSGGPVTTLPSSQPSGGPVTMPPSSQPSGTPTTALPSSQPSGTPVTVVTSSMPSSEFPTGTRSSTPSSVSLTPASSFSPTGASSSFPSLSSIPTSVSRTAAPSVSTSTSFPTSGLPSLQRIDAPTSSASVAIIAPIVSVTLFVLMVVVV